MYLVSRVLEALHIVVSETGMSNTQRPDINWQHFLLTYYLTKLVCNQSPKDKNYCVSVTIYGPLRVGIQFEVMSELTS